MYPCAGSARPLQLKDEYSKLQRIKMQLIRIKARVPTSHEAADAKEADHDTQLVATVQDVEVTKSAVLKILMELLKEPDFREHLLDLGLKAAQARLEKDTEEVNARKESVVHLASEEDRAMHDVDVSNMQRNRDAGDKVAKEEAFVNEHKDYISAAGSNQKGAFIIQTIIDKINQFCEKKAAADGTSGAAQSAAIRPLLAAAQAAAEAAWRAGGDR